MFEGQNLILYGTAFFTASVSGAVGMVGGTILLSVMAQFYRIDVLIPLHGMIQLVSNLSRAAILFPNVNWSIGGIFLIGALIGGFSGSHLVLNIPDHYYKIFLGLFILWTAFKTKPKKQIRIPGKWFLLGTAASFLSLFVGAVGVLVGAFFVNEGLPKKQLAATQSVCQFMVHLIKVAVYFSVGFTMAPHLEIFSIIVLMTIAGNYFGTRVLEKIPEKAFYTMLRIVIVLLTARMMIGGIATLMD